MNASLTSPSSPPWWQRAVVGRRPGWTLVRIVVLIVVSVIVSRGFLVPIRVTGHSMAPTYRDGRVNLVNRLAYRRTPPRRGDVVGIRKGESRLVVMKRIAGLPGEQIVVHEGRVYINGEPLEEPYASGRGIPSTRRPVRLGENEYFAIGDNREVTAYDVVRVEDIQGRVLF